MLEKCNTLKNKFVLKIISYKMWNNVVEAKIQLLHVLVFSILSRAQFPWRATSFPKRRIKIKSSEMYQKKNIHQTNLLTTTIKTHHSVYFFQPNCSQFHSLMEDGWLKSGWTRNHYLLTSSYKLKKINTFHIRDQQGKTNLTGGRVALRYLPSKQRRNDW